MDRLIMSVFMLRIIVILQLVVSNPNKGKKQIFPKPSSWERLVKWKVNFSAYFTTEKTNMKFFLHHKSYQVKTLSRRKRWDTLLIFVWAQKRVLRKFGFFRYYLTSFCHPKSVFMILPNKCLIIKVYFPANTDIFAFYSR